MADLAMEDLVTAVAMAALAVTVVMSRLFDNCSDIGYGGPPQRGGYGGPGGYRSGPPPGYGYGGPPPQVLFS